MKLSDIIKKIGDANIGVQFVNSCMSNIAYSEKKRTSKITFETDQLTPNDIVLGEGNIGLILWIPKDKWEKATKE